MKHILGLIIFLIVIGVGVVLGYKYLPTKTVPEKPKTEYIASDLTEVILYDTEYNESLKLVRGSKVYVYSKEIVNEDSTYKKVTYDNKEYLVNINNLVKKEKDVVKENELYVRTSTTIYKDMDTAEILSFVKKGEKVEVVGFDKINEDGTVNKYKIKYNDSVGYVYSKYLVTTEEESKKVYSENGIMDYMATMGSSLGGGAAVNLDFYPYDKPKFEDNVMPDEARTLYINSAAIRDIKTYVDFAVNNNINALVIDIKDNTSPAYNSPITKKYSPTNYERALNNYEDYKNYVKIAKEAGLYLIGRITTFKDSYFINDHKEIAISNSNGDPFSHNGSYWPSAFNRYVWEFNVELAREAVREIGFNEIQFDYVRFPDRTGNLEKNGTINLKNIYEEEKAQAIQAFVMYACDSIHELGAYVSIDVFGESANNYVTAYGQFWPAISNVADVISGMPYPDHFNIHEYGISEVVWEVPYKVLYQWGKTVAAKQSVIPTPAVVRTWIQTYNATRAPHTIYDANKISDQIQALYDNGLRGGFMTWNSASSIYKYNEVAYAFRKVYE